MNKVLLVGFLLAIATQSLGQGIVVQNSNPTSSIANRGSYIADSIFRIGTRDTVKPSWWNPAWSFNGALQIGLDGKPYYYYGGYWRNVGSGASVTSITQGYGMALSPSPIVSTGSVSVDTTAISTKANVNSLLSAKVPYVGATTNVNLGEFQATVGQVTLDQTPTQAAGVGVLRWNDSDGTADLGLKGGNVSLQIGQEEVVRVVNKTGANLLESQYHAVYVSGAQGQRLKVGNAIALADSSSAATIGLVTENITLNQEGFITTNGLVRNINTTGSLQGETWNDGDLLFLSGTTAGQITNVKPIAPTHTVIIGYVVYAHAVNGKIFVKVDNGYELDELHNVRIVSAANNQGLFYDSVAKLWENKSISTVLGYTPANNATVVKYADTAAMLAPYATDAQVALKLNIADTANMRIRPIAGSNMTISGTYPNVTFASTTIPTDSTIFATNYRVDTAKANLRTSINTKLNSADTASLSTRIDARVRYSDTSTILGGYLRKVDTSSLSNRINLKLNSADTASLSNRINLKLNSADTLSLSNRINLKLNSADTASLSTRIDARVKYSDTSTMLGGYLRKVDTASLSNRINAKGSGTITSIATTNGTGITGGTITTTGTLAIDTTLISTRLWRQKGIDSVNAQLALKANIASPTFTGTVTIPTGANITTPNILSLTSGTTNDSLVVADATSGTLRRISSSRVGLSGLTTNYVPKATSATAIGNSQIFDNGTSVGIGTITPNASAELDIVSTTQGLGLPSMTTTQQNAIATPRTGLEIYNSTLTTPQFYNGSVWTGAWYKRGNAGTDAANDFIGTTDGVDVMFRRGNVRAGWLNGPLANTSFGVSSMPITATSGNSTAFGHTALSALTSGNRNNAFGRSALAACSTGMENTAIGDGTLGALTTGAYNVGMGTRTLESSNANYNTAIGYRAMLSNTTGGNNCAFGAQAGYSISTGTSNSAFGYGALLSSTTGTGNSAFGSDALSRTTGIQNTGIGNGAAFYSTTGNNNASVGNNASFNLTTGANNTTLGTFAGYYLYASSNNVYLGYGAGNNFQHNAGDKNLLVGYNALPAVYTGSNQLNLGNVLWGVGCSGTGQTPAGSLSVGATAPNASAIFDIVSTTQGLGLPSMTTTQQNAIATPRAGLSVYNSTLNLPTFYNGTAWSPYFSGWGLTGNAGTSDATNFIGTTDGVDVIFRRNNVVSGRLNDAKQVTSFGVGALPTTSTGDGNTAFGWKALNVSTSGGANTALGFWSLRLCTTGFSNSAVGQLSLGSLTTGFSNCAFGEGSGQGVTSGTSNTFYGNGSGNAMTTGADNIGIGVNAMSTSTAGGRNLVISASGAVPSTTGSNQLNIGNVLWGVNCSGTGTTAAGRLGIGTTAPNASAILDLTSTTQGLLLPRMTTTEINAIGSPAAGLTVYNTTLALICFYNGTAWQKVTATAM